jgi:heme a synthase
MLENTVPKRSAPRWLHVLAILTMLLTFVLLALGGLVTTFRVGMADPVWPTVPWYLFFIDWREPSAGFLIEHAHRLAGFSVGGATAVLVIGLWLTDPRRLSRWLGLISLLALLASFGQFHRMMMAQAKAATIVLPVNEIVGMAVSLGVVLLCGLAGMAWRVCGAGLRTLGVVVLVAVMLQGLLGGLRVRLNAWAGTDLAAVHGIFAQVVLALMAAIALLTARSSTKAPIDPDERWQCRRLAGFLTALVFLQLIWGALVRHNPNSVVQRLHLLTAFAVVAAAVWLLKTAFKSATARGRLNHAGTLLAILLMFQVLLGVEAWMGKFTSGILPELQQITSEMAIVRIAHVLVGTGILATSVCLMLLTRKPIKTIEGGQAATGRDASPATPALAGPAQLGGVA